MESNTIEVFSESKEQKKSPEMTNRPLEVVIQDGFDERSLTDILALEEACYPKGWQYDDSKSYYEAMLRNECAIHVFLREGEITAGYLLARPLSEVYEELKEYDPDLRNDPACYYLETIGVHPNFAGRQGGARFLEVLYKEVQKKEGYRTISAHARIKTRLHELIKNKYPDRLLEVRAIPAWHFGGGEPYEYIVWGVF